MWAKVVTGTASGSSAFNTLTGYAITETAGAIAQVSIRDASAGNIMWLINLAASESMGEQFGENPVSLEEFGAGNGKTFYFSVDAGDVRWTAYGR